LDKSHNLLRDSLIVAIYNLASINIESFYTQLVPQYLAFHGGGRLSSRKDSLLNALGNYRDLPTFTLRMNQFLNDATYYYQTSAAVPTLAAIKS